MSAALADTLRERILSGAAAPDLPLRQDAIAAELGVSKIPLREAMARLEHEGLVRAEPNRGWFVRPLDAAEAREVFELRLALEPELAALAASRADEGERAAARAAFSSLEQAADEARGSSNRAFHLALVAPAGRPVTFDIVERLHILADRYVRKHLEPRGRDARADAEHRIVLDAWLARDGGAVASMLRDHIAETLADLEAQLAR